MVYDIAFGLKRSEFNTKAYKLEWSEIVERLRKVTVCGHTMQQYKEMSKRQRVDVKDVGFFIGGLAVKRKVTYRQLLVMDIDEVAPDTITNLRTFLGDSSYILHSTHSHTPEEQRFRVVAPLSRIVMADEYGAIMRILHEKFGLPIDIATFDFNRIMFLPSVPSDATYLFEAKEGGSIDVQELLGYTDDWKDLTKVYVPEKVHVQDPKHKGGIVGAFCAKVGIREAIETYLTDVWKKEPTGRYTLAGASTFSGGIVYEDTYLYSNHSTDKYLGRSHNAYDAVRLYKFGDGKQGEALMAAFCESLGIKPDSGKSHAITLENMADEEAKAILTERLEVDKQGVLRKTLKNAKAILEYDPEVAGVFGYDLFSEMPVLKRLPSWRSFEETPQNEDCKNLLPYTEMADVDESYMRLYLEESYDFDSRAVLTDALSIVEHQNSFHPVRDYLSKLEWDGVERLKFIFIKCFGVPDSAYARDVGIKFFVGAVRRVFIPSSKMDYIPVLVSEEGLGKSKFIKRMSKLWGSDTFYTFSGGKEAYEQLRGVWLLEIPELNGVQSRSTNSRKAFITKGEDRYRGAYLKYMKTYKRQCVFIASSNDVVFLDDPSEDGRRWWGLMCDKDRIEIDVFSDEFLELVDKYWAEAVHYFHMGVLPVLSKGADEEAKVLRAVHKAENVEQGALIDYLNMPVPENWRTMSIVERRIYYQDERPRWRGEMRDEICNAEVAREFYEYERKDMTQYNGRKVSEAIRATGLFMQNGTKKNFGDYGSALVWFRKKNKL